MNNCKFSICIPVWEQHGVGLQYLNDLMNSILKQTLEYQQIVISDHSKDDKISNYILGVMYHFGHKMNIKYTRFREKYGNGVANLNNALRHADGEIIKVMFQDDLMFSQHCLQNFKDCFENDDIQWVVCGCNHTKDGANFDRYIAPSWNDQLLYGENTISSPSVVAFRNTGDNYFDENLTMLMDVEFYYSMYMKYGLPKFITDCLITNRQHPDQISSRYDKDINEEITYVKGKYNQA